MGTERVSFLDNKCELPLVSCFEIATLMLQSKLQLNIFTNTKYRKDVLFYQAHSGIGKLLYQASFSVS